MRLIVIILVMIVSAFSFDDAQAQRGRRGRDRTVVVVRHSRYRPRRVVAFRPHWHPRVTFHRRWVYFPRYNFYWDNWRNRYVYFNGTVWVSKSKAPTSVKESDLSTEKYYELDEADDDNDEISSSNKIHQEKYRGN